MSYKIAIKTTAFAVSFLISEQLCASSAHANRFARYVNINCVTNILEKTFNPSRQPTLIIPTSKESVNLITDEAWINSEKIFIKGTNETLSFSYDGELAWDEVLAFIKDDPEAMSALNKLFPERYNKAQILKKINMSEKQFDAFVLKKGTPLADQGSWLASELPPRYFAFMIEGKFGKEIVEKPIEVMAQSIVKVMRKRGFIVDGHSDSGFVELTHPTFDVKPSVFEKTMHDFDQHFPKSTMHIGIPLAGTSKIKTTAISRAIEAKAILTLAEQNTKSELPYIVYSSLRNEREIKTMSPWRGVIRTGFNEFKNADNIEIRQYVSMNDGIGMIKLGSNLSSNSHALYEVEHFNPLKIKDLRTSNLNGALEYVGILFKNKGSEEYLKLGDEMISMAKQMEKEKAISDNMRHKVEKFLETNKIVKKLEDPSLYLKMD